jgi:hypothetical protein
MQPQPIQAVIMVGLKGGGIPSGSYRVNLRVLKPNEFRPVFEIENDVFFNGLPEHGVTIGTPLLMLADEEGLYWVELRFIDRMITRIPFRVTLVAVPTIQPGHPPGGVA